MMEIVSVEELTARPKRRRAARTDSPAAAADAPVAAALVTTAPPAAPVLPPPVVPLPSSMRFDEDEKYRGITAAMDKVLDVLHRDGWSMDRLYRSPSAVLPLPEGRFPPGRVYLFSDSVAVVASRSSGEIFTSLPAHAALQTLNQFTPHVLEADEWASQRWESFLESQGDESTELVPRWWKQSWFDRAGSIWTVKRVRDGARVYKDGTLLNLVETVDEAEDLDFHPVIVELIDFVLHETD